MRKRTGAHILLAQKAFSAFCVYPLLHPYLDGTTASGLFEARLGKEEFGKETHVFSPAYKEAEFPEILSLCDHVIFNSISQVLKYKAYIHGQNQAGAAGAAGFASAGQETGVSTAEKVFSEEANAQGVSVARPAPHQVSFGLRLNPECSTQEGHAIYDPCAAGSRLGVTLEALKEVMPDLSVPLEQTPLAGLEGLHFHTLCEQNADALATTLQAVEEKFAPLLRQVKWVNFGGGHHITRKDYDIALLEQCIARIKETYDVEVYLEPGEAVALNAGYLVTEVLELVQNGPITTAILDASAACHMPDVLEMPYRPPLRDAGEAREKPYTYRLSSYTCLAGDIIGDYSFDAPLSVGDRLIFEDMAIYSMVKNNTFNGICLPSIYTFDGKACHLVKAFGYEDFKERLS